MVSPFGSSEKRYLESWEYICDGRVTIRQLNTTFKAAYHQKFKRRATRMNKTMFGPDQLETDGTWETSCETNHFSASVFNENKLRVGKQKLFSKIFLFCQLWEHKV